MIGSIFPGLLQDLLATASTSRATAAAAATTLISELDSATQNPRRIGRSPGVDPNTGLPRRPSSAKSNPSKKTLRQVSQCL